MPDRPKEQGRNEKLDELATEEEKHRKQLLMQGGSIAVYKDMMRNYKSQHKKYLDAIRFKSK
jgi:hypothetical protein